MQNDHVMKKFNFTYLPQPQGSWDRGLVCGEIPATTLLHHKCSNVVAALSALVG